MYKVNVDSSDSIRAQQQRTKGQRKNPDPSEPKPQGLFGNVPESPVGDPREPRRRSKTKKKRFWAAPSKNEGQRRQRRQISESPVEEQRKRERNQRSGGYRRPGAGSGMGGIGGGGKRPERFAVGDKVVAGEKCDTKPGNAMLLGQMPVGTICHNVEMKPGKGGQIARAAGSYVQLVGRDRGMVIVRLNSGEQRYLRADCMGTVGAVSNPDNQNQNLGKAGRRRWMGIKPLTRGVAKNPVDHPHGGGEGRTSGGRHPVTPWGKPTKGARPRKNKQTDKMIIRSRHAKKKR
mgnify:CR=1 FL=1